MNGGGNSHGQYQLRPSHLLAISRQSRESSKIGILRSTAESVETCLLTLIRSSWYSTYAVRNLFGHKAGVSDRYRLPTFCIWPLAPWGTARWGQDGSPCTDRNVTRLTPYPQWYGPDDQNIQFNTNMNDAHPQMDVEPVIDAANAEPEPPNPVHSQNTSTWYWLDSYCELSVDTVRLPGIYCALSVATLQLQSRLPSGIPFVWRLNISSQYLIEYSLYPFSIYIIVGSLNRLDDLNASSSEGAYRCHFAGYEPKCFLCYKAE